MTKTVTIELDGRKVEVDPSKPLIHACHREDVDVPMYCYHPGLSPVGSCRICQVEVQQGEMPPRVVVACRTPVVEGMVVSTSAEKARDARRECLEFLLKNHPLDCPICDKAGECDLQDFSFDEGQGEGRSVEPRRKLEKRKGLGDVIVLDQERCILCSRCVRFFEEVPKKAQLTVSGLGSRSVISTFQDRPLEGNYQGNIADICPVGALTLKEFRFQARVWNLRKAPSTCGECSRGCAISIEVLRKGGSVKRVRPRVDEEVNGWWMCDTGRFAFHRWETHDRLRGAEVREAGGLQGTDSATGIERAADVLRAVGSKAEASVRFVASPFLTQEDASALLELAGLVGAEVRFVSPPPNDLADDVLHTGDPCPNRRGLEQLGIAGAPADELVDWLRDADAALLAGDRVIDLVGADGLAELTSEVRLVCLDTRGVDSPATRVSIAVPYPAELGGHWINVDGLKRRLTPARPPSPGCTPVSDIAAALRERLAPSDVSEADAEAALP